MVGKIVLCEKMVVHIGQPRSCHPELGLSDTAMNINEHEKLEKKHSNKDSRIYARRLYTYI